jgi:hypothetical protein
MTRGGKREGAGAPAKPEGEKAKRVTFALHPRTIETIKTKAAALGISEAKLVARAVDALTVDPPPG